MTLQHLTETELTSLLVVGVVGGLVVYHQSELAGSALLANSVVAALVALGTATGALLLIKRSGESDEASSVRES